MNNPKIQPEISVTKSRRRRQPVNTENPVGKRLLIALEGRDFGWLSQQTGIPTSTIGDYVQKGISRADNAVKIADVLNVTTDWLLRPGSPAARPMPIDAEAADWIEVPEFDLRQLNERGKGDPISTTLFRRDWLNRAVGRDRGLWLTSMPSDYDPLDLFEGDVVLCINTSREELSEKQLCIWWAPILAKLIVARYSVIERGGGIVTMENGDYWAHPHLVEGDSVHGIGADLIPIGRIVGRPISRIR